MDITRTSSPYFSPNNASAPSDLATSKSLSSISKRIFFWISSFTKLSIFKIS